MVTPYAADSEGFFRPERPSSCCLAALGVVCQLVVSHWRARKTGPQHPLLVMRCRDHGRAFTVYPCGHVPYGTTRIAPVTEGGSPLSTSDPWRATVFAATLDASLNDQWPRDSPPDDPRRLRTQSRRLERAGLLLGLGDMAPVVAQGLVPTLLAGDAVTAVEAALLLDSAVGIQARGQIVAELLEMSVGRPNVLDTTLIAGAVAGLWGPPIRWEPARGCRRFLMPAPHPPP